MLEELDLPIAGGDREPLSQDEDLVIVEARERLDRAVNYEITLREKAAEDVRFLNGDQWPADIRRERETDGRPLVTVNKLPQYVDQVVGEQRQNRPAIKVVAADGELGRGAENLKETKTYDLAEVYTGLCRDIEHQSNADQAYDWAYQQAVEHGFGHWRVTTEYSDDSSFDQDLRIKRIRNSFQVHWDPASEEWDKTDAKWCIVSTELTREEFRTRWPDAGISDLQSTEGDWQGLWWNDDMVRIAEYWRKVPKTKTILRMSDGTVVEETEKSRQVLDDLAAKGITVEKFRKVKSYVIEWRLINAIEVLEKKTVWPGKYIPIITCYGKEIFVDGRPEYRGIVRYAKEPQQLYNYWRSSSTELVALAPKMPWVIADDQVEGFETLWEQANVKNLAYLTYRGGSNAPAPQRPALPQIPIGAVNEALTAGEDIKAAVGMYDPSVGNRQDSASGVAIERLQKKGDVATFAFIDNLTRAIRHTGKVLIDLIPKIYDGERIVRIQHWDETEDFVEINKTVRDEETGEDVVLADLSVGKYDVRVRAGPSYTTQREESQDGMIQFISTVPDAAAAMSDLIVEAMDWPNADKISARLKKTLPPGLLEPEEGDEDQQPQAPEPTPADQAETAKAEATVATAEADKAKAEASILESQYKMAQIPMHAQVDNTRAEADIVKAQAGMANNQMDTEERVANRGIDSEEQVREVVAKAIAEYLAGQQPRPQGANVETT